MTSLPTADRPTVRVALRKNLTRAVRAGHPWIFRDALRSPPPLADGALVLVTTGDGRPLGRGFWTASTPLAVRMLTTEAGDDLQTLLETRLAGALCRRLEILDLSRTTAFRWVHGEADRLPGLHLDVYGQYGALRFDGPGARAFYLGSSQESPGWLSRLIVGLGKQVGMRGLIERGARRLASAGGCAPARRGAEALLGDLPEGEIEVRENGLLFGVDLAHGQKGGLFLDQRDNRERVRGLAQGRRVLNLFGYTGGFSVYAAAGGAVSTVTVDSAAGAIGSARVNFARNALPIDDLGLVVDDAFSFLARAVREGSRWDLVISDPPSFAPNRRALPEARAAYRRLHRLCAAVLAPGGILCAASCSSHVDREELLATVEAGCADAGRGFRLREHHGAGDDHPVLPVFPEGRYLKFLIGEVQ